MAVTRILASVILAGSTLAAAGMPTAPDTESKPALDVTTTTVAGAGRATAGGTEFHLALLGVERGGSPASGEIHYWRAPAPRRNALAFVAEVRCIYVAEDLGSAALAGPVRDVQADPGQFLSQRPWVAVTVRERAAGDQLRVTPLPGPPEGDRCGASASFGGAYRDGGVEIRSW